MLSFRGKPFSPLRRQLGCGHSYRVLSESGIIGVEWPELAIIAGLACANSGDGVAGPCSAPFRCLCRLFFVLYVFQHVVHVKGEVCGMAGGGNTEALSRALGIRLLGVSARLQFW